MYRVGVEEHLTKREARAELVNLALERFHDLEGGVEGPNGRPCSIEVRVTIRETSPEKAEGP